jgi:hypothetical protein
VFTRALHWSLSWDSSIHSTPSHPISPRSILILSTHLHLGLPSGIRPCNCFKGRIVLSRHASIQEITNSLLEIVSMKTFLLSWKQPWMLSVFLFPYTTYVSIKCLDVNSDFHSRHRQRLLILNDVKSPYRKEDNEDKIYFCVNHNVMQAYGGVKVKLYTFSILIRKSMWRWAVIFGVASPGRRSYCLRINNSRSNLVDSWGGPLEPIWMRRWRGKYIKRP